MKKSFYSILILGLIITGFNFLVHGVESRLCSITPDWELRIDAHAEGGNTYCIIGEKLLASDGVDQFDVPHPPFQPEGRCFVYIHQASFPNPYKSLWMEYRHLHGLWRVWNLSCFYVPWNEEGVNVELEWGVSQVLSSGYKNVILVDGNNIIDMKTVSSYTFYSLGYETTHMKLYCNNLYTN
jgi:hypothetical protein